MIKIVIALLFFWFAVRQIRWFLNKPDFKGKTVLITGGSSGIGESLCYEMLKLGASEIIIAARRTNELQRVANASDPGKVKIWELDLSKPEECLEKARELGL